MKEKKQLLECGKKGKNTQRIRSHYIITGIITGLGFAIFFIFHKKVDINTLVQIYICCASVFATMIAGVAAVSSWYMHTENKRITVFSFWYKTIIIDKYLKEIDSFFCNIENLLLTFSKISEQRGTISGEAYDRRLMEEVSEPFTTEYTKLRKSLVADLELFSHDISVEISSLFSEYQDAFFNEVIEIRNPSMKKIREETKERREIILKKLMEFDVTTIAQSDFNFQ